MREWAEWEATALRPASFTQGAALTTALQHLEAGVKGETYLVGGALTLADVGGGLVLRVPLGLRHTLQHPPRPPSKRRTMP